MNIKVSVIAEPTPPKNLNFPIMMENVGGDHMIVYFHGMNQGTLVFIDPSKEDPAHRLFKEYNDWIDAANTTHWKPYNGEILIETQSRP